MGSRGISKGYDALLSGQIISLPDYRGTGGAWRELPNCSFYVLCTYHIVRHAANCSVGTQSIHALSRLQHTRSSDYIIQRLSQPEYVEGVSTDCIPFSCIIPITVYRLTSISGITLREVYDTLGYTDVDFVTGTVLGGSDLMWSLQLMSESLDERVKNLCKQAPDAILLLLLFHALFGFRPFSKVLVEGGLEARQQIRLDGQLENLEIACLGLEDRLARLLTKPIREDCLRYLRTAGIIKQHAGFYQIVASQDDLNLASIPTFWFREALKLGCYYFSGSNLTPR